MSLALFTHRESSLTTQWEIPRHLNDFGSGLIYSWSDIQACLAKPLRLHTAVSVHLIRHAESRSNSQKLVTGARDIPLSPMGEEQARRLGKKLDSRYDIALCSTLRRSRRTMELSLTHGRHGPVRVKQICKDKRLSERKLGVLEGQPAQWIAAYAAGDLTYAPEGGESYLEVAQRILSFLIDLCNAASTGPGKTVLICGHMGTMRILVGIIENKKNPIDVLNRSFPNAEVLKYEWSALKFPAFLDPSLKEYSK